MNVLNYLKWQFGGFYKDLTFWGMMIGILSAVAAYFGCPAPVPMIMLVVSIVTILFDGGRAWFRFSYSLYRLEQNEMLRKLREKEQS